VDNADDRWQAASSRSQKEVAASLSCIKATLVVSFSELESVLSRLLYLVAPAGQCLHGRQTACKLAGGDKLETIQFQR
jgi:hypothetical protein